MCGSELRTLPDGVQRVAAELQRLGHPQSPDGVAVLVVTSGDRRVCEDKVAALVCTPGEGGTKLGRANAEFVKAATGFSIGGVSPLAHATPPVTLIDRELFRFDQVWAAAGHPHAV
ncbi:MAG: YbaK/EbsC family protein, partial [Burkholderiales bacterium]|nr:YbaK/EbsC family protein [Burkholderiales bacterium]